MPRPSPQMEMLSARLNRRKTKDDRYDQTMARRFLRAMGFSSGDVSVIAKEAGDEFGMASITRDHLSSEGLATQAVKLSKHVDLAAILRGGSSVTRQPLWTAWERLHEDWDGYRNYAMVFDFHGDGVGDLVMHDLHGVLDQTPDSGRILLSFSDTEIRDVAVEPLPAFLDPFGRRFGV